MHEEFELLTLESNGIRLRAAVEGEGPLVVMVHGWPELWYSWRHQIKAIASAGYRVVAPDMRGYGGSDKPTDLEAYDMVNLMGDILGIIDSFGQEKAILIGHDWGSAVGWYLASKNSDQILTWTALSVPHLDSFLKAIKEDEEQKKKSQYISLFRKPILPELYFKIFGYKYLKNIWSESLDNEKKLYLEVFKQKNALKATLNWYRANFNNENQEIGDIYIPTLIIYGKNDMAVGEKSVDGSEKYLMGNYKIEKLDSGHWLIQESFDLVSEMILDHIN